MDRWSQACSGWLYKYATDQFWKYDVLNEWVSTPKMSTSTRSLMTCQTGPHTESNCLCSNSSCMCSMGWHYTRAGGDGDLAST